MLFCFVHESDLEDGMYLTVCVLSIVTLSPVQFCFPHGNFRSFYPRKASCDRVALPSLNQFLTESRYPALTIPNLVVYAVILYDHTTGCEAQSLTIDGYEIFNVRTNVGTEAGSCTNKSAQELIRRDRKTVPHLALPENRTQGLRI